MMKYEFVKHECMLKIWAKIWAKMGQKRPILRDFHYRRIGRLRRIFGIRSFTSAMHIFFRQINF